MEMRTLGNTNLEVSALGLGCMRMSHDESPLPDKQEMIRLLQSAVERDLTAIFAWLPCHIRCRSKQAQAQLNRLRLICEKVKARLQEQLHLSRHYAKTTWDMMTRIAAKVTAHSVGMIVNTSLGRPALKLADLAV